MVIQTGSSIRWGLLLLNLLLSSCSWLHQAPAPIVKGISLEEAPAPPSTPTEAISITNDASDIVSSEERIN